MSKNNNTKKPKGIYTPAKKERLCLVCDRPFISEGYRTCQDCKNKNFRKRVNKDISKTQSRKTSTHYRRR